MNNNKTSITPSGDQKSVYGAAKSHCEAERRQLDDLQQQFTAGLNALANLDQQKNDNTKSNVEEIARAAAQAEKAAAESKKMVALAERLTSASSKAPDSAEKEMKKVVANLERLGNETLKIANKSCEEACHETQQNISLRIAAEQGRDNALKAEQQAMKQIEAYKDQLAQKTRQTQQQLSVQQANLETVRAKLDAENLKSAEYTRQLQDKSSAITHLLADKSSAASKAAEYTQKLSTLQAELNQQKNVLETQVRTTEQTQKELQSQSKACDDLHCQLTRAQQDRDALKGQLDAAKAREEASGITMRNLKDQLIRERDALNDAVNAHVQAEKDDELVEARKMMAEREGVLENLNAKVVAEHEKLVAEQNRRLAAQNQLQNAEVLVNNARKDIEANKNAVNALQAEQTRVLGQLNATQTELMREQNKNRDMEAEAAITAQKLSSAENEMNRRMQEVKGYEQQMNESLAERNARIKQEHAARKNAESHLLQGQLRLQEIQRDSANAIFNEQEARKRLEQQLADLRNGANRQLAEVQSECDHAVEARNLADLKAQKIQQDLENQLYVLRERLNSAKERAAQSESQLAHLSEEERKKYEALQSKFTNEMNLIHKLEMELAQKAKDCDDKQCQNRLLQSKITEIEKTTNSVIKEIENKVKIAETNETIANQAIADTRRALAEKENELSGARSKADDEMSLRVRLETLLKEEKDKEVQQQKIQEEQIQSYKNLAEAAGRRALAAEEAKRNEKFKISVDIQADLDAAVAKATHDAELLQAALAALVKDTQVLEELPAKINVKVRKSTGEPVNSHVTVNVNKGSLPQNATSLNLTGKGTQLIGSASPTPVSRTPAMSPAKYDTTAVAKFPRNTETFPGTSLSSYQPITITTNGSKLTTSSYKTSAAPFTYTGIRQLQSTNRNAKAPSTALKKSYAKVGADIFANDYKSFAEDLSSEFVPFENMQPGFSSAQSAPLGSKSTAAFSKSALNIPYQQTSNNFNNQATAAAEVGSSVAPAGVKEYFTVNKTSSMQPQTTYSTNSSVTSTYNPTAFAAPVLAQAKNIYGSSKAASTANFGSEDYANDGDYAAAKARAEQSIANARNLLSEKTPSYVQKSTTNTSSFTNNATQMPTQTLAQGADQPGNVFQQGATTLNNKVQQFAGKQQIAGTSAPSLQQFGAAFPGVAGVAGYNSNALQQGYNTMGNAATKSEQMATKAANLPTETLHKSQNAMSKLGHNVKKIFKNPFGHKTDAAANKLADYNNALQGQANNTLNQANNFLPNNMQNAFGQANNAFGQANNALNQAGKINLEAQKLQGTAGGIANNAFQQANNAFGQANNAFGQANKAFDTLSSTGNQISNKLQYGSQKMQDVANFGNNSVKNAQNAYKKANFFKRMIGKG